jgi:pyruvate carboxylase subunit B
MVLGYFGKTPTIPDSEVVKLASEQLKLEPTTENAIDIANRDEKKSKAFAIKQLEENNLEVNDENIFIVLSCAEKGIAFLNGEAKVMVRKISEMEESKPKNKKKKEGSMENYTVVVNGKQYSVQVAEGDANIEISQITAPAPKSSGSEVHLHAPLPGSVFKILAKVGEKVHDGQTVLILEAMKMETEIQSPVDGRIKSIDVSVGDSIENGQILVTIEE